MIGYYVHHQGAGHRHHALAVAAALEARGVPVTGLSSLPRPADWVGEWVRLDRDDLGAGPRDAQASGRLHWVPVGDAGLRSRTAAVSAWVERARPDLLVCDVSVEVTLLARLHGVPVVSVVLPGRRDDPAHRLGHAVAAALVAPCPPEAGGAVLGLAAADCARLHCVGGISRFPVRSSAARRPGPPRVTVLLGEGGGAPPPETWTEARAQAPGWEWTVLGRGAGTWTDRPYDAMCDADVVVTQAGLTSLAEVAAARRPAVVVPADRPHDEQRATARALAAGPWPVRVETERPREGWGAVLAEAAALDGAAWETWTDGRAADRFADVVTAQLPLRPGARAS